MTEQYSTQAEFLAALGEIDELLIAHEVVAFLDTLDNGDPAIEGPQMPLSEFVKGIIAQAEAGEWEAAVYDTYRFDGTPFSLISYLMKAEMVGNISTATLMDIINHVPLPPIPVPDFVPPLVPAAAGPPPPICPCKPEVRIRVTWEYQPKCGNYSKKITGYAAGNTLTGMDRSTVFRLDAEVHGCTGPGTWNQTVDPIPSGVGYAGNGGNKISVIASASATFKVKFTYMCNCVEQCGRGDEATFTLSFK